MISLNAQYRWIHIEREVDNHNVHNEWNRERVAAVTATRSV